jgi:pimeloyl-ACP methyl ester carboxylesterase
MKIKKQQIIARFLGLGINTLSFVYPKKALQVAYLFFSTPRKGKLDFNQLPSILKKATIEKHNVGSHIYHSYEWKGNQECILLVHGWQSNASRWKILIPQLIETGKTIVALDGPAHGLSSGKEFNIPTYVQFLEDLIPLKQPTIIIGHSIGGQVIGKYLSTASYSFEKIIFLGVPSDFSIILSNYIQILGLRKKIHQQLIDYIQFRFDIEIQEFSTAQFLSNNDTPGILFHDEIDDVVPIEEAFKIHKSWKNAQLITTKNLGHSMHDSKLYQDLISFVQN